MALEHHAEGRFDAAAQSYQQLLPGNLRDSEVRFLLGILGCDLGAYGAAIRVIEQALAISPQFPEADLQLVLASAGEAKLNVTASNQANACQNLGLTPDQPLADVANAVNSEARRQATCQDREWTRNSA